jgi:hypothetical protein
LKSDGTVWAWGGFNFDGQLGDLNSWPAVPNPVVRVKPSRAVEGSDWVGVEAGFLTSFARKRDGSLWAWGRNDWGRLGIGSWTNCPKPAQVGTATNWVKIRAGGIVTAGIQSDGSLWIWGANPKVNTSDSPENLLVPTRVTSDTNWVDVSAKGNLWLAIKSDGTLWAWGRDARMFTGASRDETPAQVGNETDWQSVCSSRGDLRDLLRKRNGTFWIMDKPGGKGGSATLRQISLPPSIIAWGAGGGAIVGVSRDGEVWTCGTIFGQLGTKYRLSQLVEWGCSRMGLNVDLQAAHPGKAREQPWQLRIVAPTD